MSKSGNSQWRGENRDGIYNETGLLKEWPADGPQLLWHFEGLGDGFTSAAIANEKLYVTGLSGDNLVLYVFDLQGQLLVKKEVGKEEDENYPGPRSTITINDGKLYIYSALGKLFCWDETTLNEVWSKDVIADFDGRNIEWRVNESPLIVGEKIYITPGGKGPGGEPGRRLLRGRQQQQVIYHRGQLRDQLAAVRAGSGMTQGGVAFLAVGDADRQVGGQLPDPVAVHLTVHRSPPVRNAASSGRSGSGS
jgi:hypothetical protein